MSNIQDALHEMGRLQEEMDILHTQFLKIQDDLERMTRRAEKAEELLGACRDWFAEEATFGHSDAWKMRDRIIDFIRANG